MHRQYGPLVREKVFGKRDLVHAFDPEDIVAVYVNNDEFPTRHTHQALVKYRKERPDVFSTTGVFLSNGKEWHRNRRLFAPLMLQEEIEEIYSNVLEEVSRDFVKLIPSILDNNNEVDLMPWLYKWALESFGVIALGQRLGCFNEGDDKVDKFVKAAHDTHRCVYITDVSPVYKYFRTPAYRKLEAAQDYVGSVIRKYLTEGKLGENALLHKMLKAPTATIQEVFAMSLDMFLAGIDTMSYTSAFAFYNLAKNPRVQKKIVSVLSEESATKTSLTEMMKDKTSKVHFLDSVVKETLRLNPIAFGNGRILATDMVLSGYKVPRATQVILQHQAASLNEKYFPHADVFLPERWEENPNFDKPMYHPVAYAPFGFGARGCMGKRIANRQLSLVIGEMVRNFKIGYHYEDIDAVCRLVSVPDRPLKLKFRPF